jgi:hypothetical protein
MHKFHIPMYFFFPILVAAEFALNFEKYVMTASFFSSLRLTS